MKKPIFLLLLALMLLIPLSFSQIDPLYVTESIDINMETSTYYTLKPDSTFKVDYVKANITFIPLEGEFMNIKSITTDPSAAITDEINFVWTNPKTGKNYFSINSHIKSYYNHKEITKKIPFPIENLDKDLEPYLEFTDIIDDNEYINEIASDLANKETDLYIVVNKIAIWIKDNIEYSLDSTTESASQKSSWVLKNRRGVCDELTALYISMLRSLGIPAKFVSGIAYTNSDLFDYNWGPHGWAEVYIPEYGWIAIDPTYGEFGFVDATHIKMQESIDAKSSNVNYEWKGRGFDIETHPLDFKVDINSQGKEINSNVIIEASYLKKNIGPDSYNLIIADIKNIDPFYKTLTIHLSKTQGLVTEPNVQTVILKPYETKKIFWPIKLDSKIESSYIYTFPSLIYTNTGEESNISFKSTIKDPTYSKDEIEEYVVENEKNEINPIHNIDLNCNKEKEIYYVNETIDFSCSLSNKGNVYYKDLKLCQDDCSIITLPINQEYEFNLEFTESQPKQFEKTISISNQDLYRVFSIVYDVSDYPSIEITNFTYPKNVKYDDSFMLTANLALKDNPKDVVLNIKNNLFDQTWNISESNKNQKLNIELNGNELDKQNDFILTISFKDYNNKEYTLQEKFKIGLENPSILTRIKITIRKVNNWILSIF